MDCIGLDIEFKSSDLKLFDNRLQTFKSWSKGDIVQCFSCSLKLNEWKKEDKPMNDQRKFSRQCWTFKST